MIPAIRIIVPIYNAERYLDRCINSILTQDFEDFELILVNDGSTDSSREIIEHFKERDKRIRCIHQKNGGLSNARNAGMHLACGTYIRFVDADDWLPQDSLSILYSTATYYDDADLTIGEYLRIQHGNKITPGGLTSSGLWDIAAFGHYLLNNYHKIYFGAAWNKLFKRDIIIKYNIQFPDGISYCEDYIFTFKYLTALLLSHGTVALTKDVVYNYIENQHSLTTEKRFQDPQGVAKANSLLVKGYDQFFNLLKSGGR